MKTTFQISLTLEQIIKNIPRAVTMYHDHQKTNKSKNQEILTTQKIANKKRMAFFFSDGKRKNQERLKNLSNWFQNIL